MTNKPFHYATSEAICGRTFGFGDKER